jgi:uncharacterized protein with GYD domain
MQTYFMFGRYSQESLKGISARRTEQSVGMIESFNGQVTAMYALMGQYDIVLIVNLPGNREALESSIALTRLTGIDFITSPAFAVERFDDMIESEMQKQMKNAV